MRKILFVSILSFVFLTPVYADCDYQKEAELSRIASNVQISYNYRIEDEGVIFDITLTNLTNDIYVRYNNSVINAEGEYTLSYTHGGKITFKFYSKECGNKHILTKYITLPTYNYFYETEECKTNPNFRYCKMWDNLNISEYEFDLAYEAYAYPETDASEEAIEEKQNTFKQVIDEHIKEIIASIVSVILLIIIFVIKFIKRKK